MREDRRSKSQTISWSIMVALIMAGASHAQVGYKVYGLNFSPYIDGQDPSVNPAVSTAQINARMQIVAPYTVWVRSFSMTNGLEEIPTVARSLGLKVAGGAWISTNTNTNAIEINNLIAAAIAGKIDIAIVGSESLLRGDVSESQLIGYINQVRQAIPASVKVATADTVDVLLSHPNVIAAGDVVMANFYPYWEGVSELNAICSLISSYQQLVTAASGKQVIISETGWPSAGNAVGAAVPSPQNASEFFSEVASWARANNIPFFYFEAFDESWKASREGAQGAHWGIWDTSGTLKAGTQPVFDGQTVPITCNGVPGGPGTPAIAFTYIPVYGTSDSLEGQTLHIVPANFKIAAYINVSGGWWSKPTFAQPITSIQQDGSWLSSIVTGGSDQAATAIAAFLIPNGYNPPLMSGSPSLPTELYQNSVANTQGTRSQNSISGHIDDSGASPLPGVTVTLGGLDSTTTQSAPDGKYSFPKLTGAGPYTIVPSGASYSFSPQSYTYSTVTGNQIANFSAAANLAPSVTLLNPTVSTGASQSYSFQFTDPNGSQDLSVLNVLINNVLDGRQACYIAYVQQSNTLFLVDDAGDAGGPYAGSLVLNGSGSVGNSQCTVNGVGSSAVGSGNTLTLTLNLTFTSAFGGNKVVYLAVRDFGQNNSGWQTMGVHGVPPLPVTYPSPVSMMPASGSTANPTLAFTFQDASTAGNLQTGWALINTAIDGRNACYVAYYRPGNQVYLYPDNGDGAQATSMVLAGTNSVSNTQCTVSAQGSSIMISGSQMIVSLNISVKRAFAGPKGVWMAAQTIGGTQTSSWQVLGAWQVPAN